MSDHITEEDFAHHIVEAYMKVELQPKQMAYVKIKGSLLESLGLDLDKVRESIGRIAKDHGRDYQYSSHILTGKDLDDKEETYQIIEWTRDAA